MRYGDNPAFLEYHWRGLQLLAGNAYVLAGLLLLVILGIIAWSSRRSARVAPRELTLTPLSHTGAAHGEATARTCGAAGAP